MKTLEKRKDPRKAVLLALFPGLGFLYLENIMKFLTFIIIVALPLFTISTTGKISILLSFVLYGISIFYTYVTAIESLKNKEIYKKDPYYILCLSLLIDGLGQYNLKQRKKAYFMMIFGLTNCLFVWGFFASKNGLMGMILATNESNLYWITNILIVWLIASIPIKFLSLMDAFYSTYHLYVAKK